MQEFAKPVQYNCFQFCRCGGRDPAKPINIEAPTEHLPQHSSCAHIAWVVAEKLGTLPVRDTRQDLAPQICMQIENRW
jgi:hypothetical protein